MDTLKALVLDIETSPLLVYTWELGEQHVNLNQIHTDWHIMAWSAKWVGEPDSSIVYYDQRNLKIGNDKPIMQPLWELLNEADVVVTQNGQKFDSRKINARFMLHGMKPPKPYIHFDTYRQVKKVAAFTSNRLEYLTEKFCVKHQKVKHGKYPGFDLWIECMKGNKEAWDEMKRYNVKDVLSTEELYLTLRAWAPESMPKLYRTVRSADLCATCGYTGEMIRGRDRIHKGSSHTQLSCPKCGAWQTYNQRQAALHPTVIPCEICHGATRSNGLRTTKNVLYRRLTCLKCGHSQKQTIKRAKGAK